MSADLVMQFFEWDTQTSTCSKMQLQSTKNDKLYLQTVKMAAYSLSLSPVICAWY